MSDFALRPAGLVQEGGEVGLDEGAKAGALGYVVKEDLISLPRLIAARHE